MRSSTFKVSMVMSLCACSLALSAATPTWSQEQNATIPRGEVKRIEALLEKQVEAWNRYDLEGFMATYWKSESLTFSSGGKTTRGWQATLDRYKSKYSTKEKMGRLRFDELEVQPLADQVAYVLGRWHLTLEEGDAEGNFTLVLKKIRGQWKIIHDHSSLDETPSEE